MTGHFFMDWHNYNLTVSFHTGMVGNEPLPAPWQIATGRSRPGSYAHPGVDDLTGSKVMHTLTLVLATAAIVAGMAASDDLRRAPQANETCVLTCLLRSAPR
ncbi:hypothetical protein KOEU_08530 [Komagataeibacter europaeus]|uniref:Uncharacterized protein n=1 Tax=Komagataeibacter europaeus TaxID=33995 RepID=A0A0M0EK14_KOMEU|nr:hypothetical protein KOEU_08530 [Komagataeibacter europaeus]